MQKKKSNLALEVYKILQLLLSSVYTYSKSRAGKNSELHTFRAIVMQ